MIWRCGGYWDVNIYRNDSVAVPLRPCYGMYSLIVSNIQRFTCKFSCESFRFKHCVKSVRIRSYSGPYLPTFELNSERYRVSLCIQSECRKIRTRRTPNRDTFEAMMLQYLEMYLLFSMPSLTRYYCILMNTETHLRIWQIPMIKMFLRK